MTRVQQNSELWTLMSIFVCTAFTYCPTVGVFHRPQGFDRLMIPKIDFHNGEMKAVDEGEERLAVFELTWEPTNSTLDDSLTVYGADLNWDFLVTVASDNTEILEVVDSPYQTCVRYEGTSNNVTFSVKGVFLGYTKIIASLDAAPVGCLQLIRDFSESGDVFKLEFKSRKFALPVSVVRPPSYLVHVVTGIMVTLVTFSFINMGVQVNMQNVGKVLKKPIGPCIGFFCQFFFMPLASFGAGYLLFDDVSFRLGLFTLGCSPGGSMSNFWTLLFGGDLDLSVTMTFISTFAALGMMPLWIFTLGRSLFRDREATIPYLNLTGSLVMLIVPVGAGLLIRQYSPRLAKISEAILKPLCVCVVIVGIGFTLYVNKYVFYFFTWQIIIAAISIAWGGYCFGALVAWMARLKKHQIIAVSIETALQNPGVAFVLLLLSLPQPEADLTLVPVMAQMMVTGIPMYIVLISLKIVSCCRPRFSDDETNKESGVDSSQDFSGKDYLPLETNPQKATIVPSTACSK